MEKNQVILGENSDLFRSVFEIENINWITEASPNRDLQVEAKVRYSQKASPAVVHPLSETRARVEFREPQRAITPGQACVLYDGEYVVGGGTIVNVEGQDS